MSSNNTVVQLREKAKLLKLKNYSKLRKEELIKLISNNKSEEVKKVEEVKEVTNKEVKEVKEVKETNEKTKVVNVKKKFLQQNGFKDFEDWASDKNNIYIGRNMNFYVPGTNASKWANPFTVKKYGVEQCTEMYKNYILTNKELMDSLDELRGKTLGCWCHPDKCHGDILIQLMKEKEEKINPF